MRRPGLGIGMTLVALGVASLVDLSYRGPDAFWAFQNEELTKYLPLATKMGIRK